MQRMTRRIITTTGCRDWRVEISLPLIPALLDGKPAIVLGATANTGGGSFTMAFNVGGAQQNRQRACVKE